MYLILRLSGVTYGKGILFDGILRIINKSGVKSITIGNNCRFNSSNKSNIIGINHACIFSTHHKNSKIIIGNNCGFSATVIGSFNYIEIGDDVQCGANTLITDGDWHFNDPRVGPSKPIIIKNNVWLGYGVVVLKGVEIGENTIIGANSVVTSNIPANVIASGNPCRVVKEIKK
ncbi:MAG: acyltransferase [Flavobacterium sp.]|uniref:acyltransferase n=1 Tax=Flavobacterium sp. TaxID=239 RepID=UPI002627733A|nr:acyltransferase [Flavobacterium sp.]MDD5151731.1 acyltransferase [Flavobacterium sp.]